MNKQPVKKYRIAVLDDYQNVAPKSADWSVLRDRADIAVFQDHIADPDAVIGRLMPFDVVCVMRERTPLPRSVIECIPNLKLIASTGTGNASIDVAAAGDHGIAVVHTGYRSDPTIEFTWALILASGRHIVTEKQLSPIRRLAANRGHRSPWKDLGRSRTWAGWIDRRIRH
jgi:lactate dehydrogenase-like 2-hydroxyacid dehydrogenase